jgi:hypothetical protein
MALVEEIERLVVDWEIQIGEHVGLSDAQLGRHRGKAWLQHLERMVHGVTGGLAGRLQDDRPTGVGLTAHTTAALLPLVTSGSGKDAMPSRTKVALGRNGLQTDQHP